MPGLRGLEEELAGYVGTGTIAQILRIPGWAVRDMAVRGRIPAIRTAVGWLYDPILVRRAMRSGECGDSRCKCPFQIT